MRSSTLYWILRAQGLPEREIHERVSDEGNVDALHHAVRVLREEGWDAIRVDCFPSEEPALRAAAAGYPEVRFLWPRQPAAEQG